MDGNQFDALVARVFRGANRRETVTGVLAGAVAAAVPALAEAKPKQAKHKHRKGKQAKAAGKDTPGRRQVRAEAKKPFCLCQGTSAAQCTPTNCVGCAYQGELGKKARKRIQKQFPFSFKVTSASECPGTTTTTTTTAGPTTTTTTTSAPVTCDPPCGFNQVCQGTTCVPAANQCPTPFTCTCPFGGPDPASDCGTVASGGTCSCQRSTEGNTVCLNPTPTTQTCTSSQDCRDTVGFGFFCKVPPRCADNGLACGPEDQLCYPACDNPA